nr:hypothetical protein [Gemmatimonadaceae bacterium]
AMTAAQAAYVVAGAVAALGWPRPTAARRALLWAWATTLTLAVALIPPAWVTDWTALDVAKAAGIAAGVGALVVWLLWAEPAQGPPAG